MWLKPSGVITNQGYEHESHFTAAKLAAENERLSKTFFFGQATPGIVLTLNLDGRGLNPSDRDESL